MPPNTFPFQPGVALYSVVLSILRLKGMTLANCTPSETRQTYVRSCLLGVTTSQKATDLVNEVIDVAGRDEVTQTYRAQIAKQLASLDRGAA